MCKEYKYLRPISECSVARTPSLKRFYRHHRVYQNEFKIQKGMMKGKDLNEIPIAMQRNVNTSISMDILFCLVFK